MDRKGLGLLLDAGVKGIILLVVAEVVLLLWKRASAATRPAVRFSAILSVVLIPFAGMVTPPAEKPVWAVATERASGNEISLTLQVARLNGGPHSRSRLKPGMAQTRQRCLLKRFNSASRGRPWSW